MSPIFNKLEGLVNLPMLEASGYKLNTQCAEQLEQGALVAEAYATLKAVGCYRHTHNRID